MVKLAEIWIKFLVKFSQKFCVRGESFFDFLCLINRRVFIALPDNRKGSNDMYDTVRRGGQADTNRRRKVNEETNHQRSAAVLHGAWSFADDHLCQQWRRKSHTDWHKRDQRL